MAALQRGPLLACGGALELGPLLLPMAIAGNLCTNIYPALNVSGRSQRLSMQPTSCCTRVSCMVSAAQSMQIVWEFSTGTTKTVSVTRRTTTNNQGRLGVRQ